jgi:hypothetical protein
VTGCGHCCCGITDNAYHAHLDPPETCGRCAARRTGIATAVTALLGPYRAAVPTGRRLLE